MKTWTKVTRALVGTTGAIQLILGVLFWLGYLRNLTPLHMAIGLVFVLALWTLAILRGRSGAPAGLVGLALVWGLGLLALGMTQTRLLVGPAHWVIQVAHLLTAIVAMGLAGALTKERKSGPARTAGRVEMLEHA